MATRTLLEIDVFKHIAEKGSISSQELANVTKADKLLLGKVSMPEILEPVLTFHRATSPCTHCFWLCCGIRRVHLWLKSADESTGDERPCRSH